MSTTQDLDHHAVVHHAGGLPSTTDVIEAALGATESYTIVTTSVEELVYVSVATIVNSFDHSVSVSVDVNV